MKKFYLFLLLLPFTCILAQTPVCNYDYTWLALGKGGVYPDSATNFISGNVGSPYLQNVTVKVPYDTTSGTTTLHYLRIDFTNSGTCGLPPGLSLTGTPSNYKFPGNDTSCMVIYGTPTTAGTYNLTFNLSIYMVEFGGFIPFTTQTLTYYKIIIAAAAGIATNNSYNFNVMQNSPNPVIDNASIKFTSASVGKAKFVVYNIAGQKITDKEINAQRGDNSFDFDATNLENGIYLYTVEMNQEKQCRKMVIAR